MINIFKKVLEKIPANVKDNIKSIGFGSMKVLIGAIVVLIICFLVMYICTLA